jgi:hypothetical protein
MLPMHIGSNRRLGGSWGRCNVSTATCCLLVCRTVALPIYAGRSFCHHKIIVPSQGFVAPLQGKDVRMRAVQCAMHGELERAGADVMLAPYVLLLIRLEATLDSLPNIKRYAETMKVQPRLGVGPCGFSREARKCCAFLLRRCFSGLRWPHQVNQVVSKRANKHDFNGQQCI